MAARTSRWLFLPLALVLILYIRDLLGQTHNGGKVVEANVRVKIDAPGVLSLLESQLDSFTSPIAVDSNGEPIEGRLPSPVLASEPLTFDPQSLDFGEQSVGMPQLATVRVINPSRTQNLHLNSISGESHVFHPSFFKSKVVKAGENEWTTFDVVFLPRVSGAVQDTLYIHTSHGTFDFKVQGVGVPNPFRMRSLLGARIPLNATYSPLITMYNPFDTTLQITEMYSSGGDLHLELLSGQLQGSKSLWEIRPYETKPIARANFFGRAAVNHTSFIRVKTSLDESPSIILPVEVEVSENHGLYLSRELLDFGILKSGETKSLPLFVLNSGPHTVHIKSISVVPDNPAVEIEPTTTFLKPGSKYLKIASVTLTPTLSKVQPKHEQSGHLEIVAEDDRRSEYRLKVPFDSTILRGTLAFEKSQTMFRVGRPPFQPLIRNISLANHFRVPLVLYDIRLSSKAQEYFTVLDFRGPFTLPPTSEWHRPFALQFQATSSDCLFNTSLRLSTNASLFNIPFYCYDGRVKYSLNVTENPDNEDVLDYGILSESDSVSKHFLLVNPNPIRITIVSFLVSDSIPFTSVELLQIEPANKSVNGAEERVQVIGKKQGAKGPFYVEPDMVAVFRVNVTNPKKLGTFTGEILIHTSFDRVLLVPVYYKTAVGSVKIVPEKNVFELTFPFAISKLPLHARSYYPQTLGIREVQVEPPDQRFYFITERTERIPHLKPQALTELGTLVFDPLRGDSDSVYLGTGESWSVAAYSNQLDAKADRKEFSVLWDVWSSMLDDGLTQLNFSYIIHTEIDTTVPVPTEASLVWPTLYPHKVLQFPHTTIGNTSVQVLKLTNPSRHPVMIQPVLLHYYPQPQRIVQVLFESGSIENTDFSRSESAFSLDPDTWGYDTSLTSHLLVPSGGKEEMEVRVTFLARDSRLSSTLLILRNNLTALEYVVIHGRGLEGQFSIDGVHPDTSSLLFQFSPSDLEKCEERATLEEPLKLTKVFRMYNSGPAHMKLTHIGLGNSMACEGNGFAVSNCGREVTININKTKKLELSVVPDFTLSRVENSLTLETTDGILMTFPLVVLIPHNMLAACYAVQPHSFWEERVAYLSTPLWLTVLFFVTMLALIRTNFGVISPDSDAALPPVQPTGGTYFDLSDITKVIHDTLLEKLDSLKKGVNSTQEHARKPHDEHLNHHKHQQKGFATGHSSNRFHPPGEPSEPENTSELRRRMEGLRDTRKRFEEDRRAEEIRKSEAAASSSSSSLSSSSSSSGGLTRKSERNRYTLDQVKKASEEAKKSASSSNASPHLHMTTTSSASSRKSTETSQGSRSHMQQVPLKLPPSDHLLPAMTTDQETGMRKFVDQLSPTEPAPISQDPASSKSKKPTKLLVMSSEPTVPLPSTPTEGQSSTSSSTSSSSAPTPILQRKGKGMRKSSAKSQKPSPVQTQTSTVTKQQQQPQSPRAIAQATVAVAMPPKVVQDHLERKESESSLKSTDSESTSSTSDKYEKEESQASSGERAEIEPNPPLAKEPGTGQTIPLLLAQEEFLLSKVKPPRKTVSATTPEDDGGEEGKREKEKESEREVVREREVVERREKLPLLPTPRNRSKKKMKQLQRKEDKMRRKEREKERVREREEERRREQQSGPTAEEQETRETSAGKQFLFSRSLEESDEHVVPPSVAEEPKTKKPTPAPVPVSPKKIKKPEPKVHAELTKSPGRSRTAPARVVLPPRSMTPPPSTSSPPPATQSRQNSSKDDGEDSDDSPDPEPLAHTWAGRELEHHFKESPEPSSPSSQPESTFSRENSEDGSSIAESDGVLQQSSHPMEAIPISALRAMRAKGLKQQHKPEEEKSAVTVAGPPLPSPPVSYKKTSTARKFRETEKLPRIHIVRSSDKGMVPKLSESDEPEANSPKFLPKKKKSVVKVSPTVDEIPTDEIPSPEQGRSENELSVKSKSSYIPPTSPHEIAATLLSKNPALKKRKVRSDRDQDGSDEADCDVKYEKRKMSEEEHATTGGGSSGKVLWEADDGSPHKHQMGLSHRYKAPTTLSLDAEPFYPSSDYVPRVKQSKKFRHPDTPYPGSHLNAPPGFSSDEAGISFERERKSRVREVHPPHRPSVRPLLSRHHGNTLTPSPPPYTIHPDAPPLYYVDGHHGMDASESGRYPRVPHDLPPYEISPEEYYAANASSRRVSPGREGLPDHRSHVLRSSAVYDDAPYSTSHQHAAAAYAAAQRRGERHHAMSGSSSNGSRALWDQSSSYLTQEEEAAVFHARRRSEIVRQQRYLRKLQEEQQAKMQARRSAEALSSLNHPHRPSRSTLYATDSPLTTHLWDGSYDNVPDAFPSAHQTDDTFLSESAHALQLRQQQRLHLMQEHMNPAPHPQPRRRHYSSDNELGGEILPDLLQTPSSPSPSSSSSTGLNKAPGTAFSGMEQARAAAAMSARERTMWPENLEKPRESTWSNTSIWSLDSPFAASSSSSSRQVGTTSSQFSGFPNSDGSNQPPRATNPERLSSGGGSTRNQSYLENTYDLFKDQSIWGIGSETPSSSILSWAQVKSSEHSDTK